MSSVPNGPPVRAVECSNLSLSGRDTVEVGSNRVIAAANSNLQSNAVNNTSPVDNVVVVNATLVRSDVPSDAEDDETHEGIVDTDLIIRVAIVPKLFVINGVVVRNKVFKEQLQFNQEYGTYSWRVTEDLNDVHDSEGERAPQVTSTQHICTYMRDTAPLDVKVLPKYFNVAGVLMDPWRFYCSDRFKNKHYSYSMELPVDESGATLVDNNPQLIEYVDEVGSWIVGTREGNHTSCTREGNHTSSDAVNVEATNNREDRCYYGSWRWLQNIAMGFRDETVSISTRLTPFFISSQAILRQSGDYLDLIANSESRDLLHNLLPTVIRTLSDLVTMEANTQHVPLANPNPSDEGARDSKRSRLS